MQSFSISPRFGLLMASLVLAALEGCGSSDEASDGASGSGGSAAGSSNSAGTTNAGTASVAGDAGVAADAVLVTNNLRHFERIGAPLRLESWARA